MSANLRPGDEVVVRPGTYNESVNITRDGSADGYVTLRSEVPGEALIRPPSSAWNAISVNADYIVVEGFDIGGARGDGIEANNVHHIVFRDNVVHDNGKSGIQTNWSEFITIEGKYHLRKCLEWLVLGHLVVSRIATSPATRRPKGSAPSSGTTCRTTTSPTAAPTRTGTASSSTTFRIRTQTTEEVSR